MDAVAVSDIIELFAPLRLVPRRCGGRDTGRPLISLASKLIQGGSEGAVTVLELRVSDAEGRQQVNNLPEWSQKHSMFHRDPFDRWPRRIEVARCPLNHQIEGSNGACKPWVFDAAMPCESLQVGAVTLFE